MARREFPGKVRVAVIKRCTRDGVVYCEKCNAMAKRWQIDHVRPDGLLGEPVIENAMLICEACWKVKNPADTSAIAQAKRREIVDLGAKAPPKNPIPSRDLPKSSKPRRERHPEQTGMTEIQRRYGL